MKVEVISDPETTTLRTLTYGDVFKYGDAYFMLLDEREDDGNNMTARMDGCIVTFMPGTIVIPVMRISSWTALPPSTFIGAPSACEAR